MPVGTFINVYASFGGHVHGYHFACRRGARNFLYLLLPCFGGEGSHILHVQLLVLAHFWHNQLKIGLQLRLKLSFSYLLLKKSLHILSAKVKNLVTT